MSRALRHRRQSTRSKRTVANRHSAFASACEALESRLLLAGILSSDIRVTGEQDFFTFDFATPRRIYFDSLTNEPRLRWSLSGPNGTLVSNRLFTQSDANDIGNPVINVLPGTYTLGVDGTGDFTGNYSFRLLDLQTDATPLTPGTQVTSSLIPGNGTDVYSFTANAGDRFNFDSISAALPNSRWRLIDRFNNIVFETALSQDINNVTLNAGGAYTLLVEGRVFDPQPNGFYAFNVLFQGNTPPVPPSGTPLTLGSTVNSSISAGGEVDSYVFTLPGDGRVAFDALTDVGNIQWSLVGPQGTVVSNRNFQQSDSFDFTTPAINLFAGTYQLNVQGTNGSTTGPYSFRLLDFASATSITPGTPKSDTLNPATETDLYQFNVPTAGSKFFFDVTTGVGNATWRLVDPFGNQLFDNGFTTDRDTLALPFAGTYTLVIEGRRNAGAGSVPYTFNVVPVTISSTPLIVGVTQNGTISVPGESDNFTFSLPGPQKLAFDVLGDFPNFNWTLTGPGGAVFVSNRAFQSSDSFDFSPPFMNLPSGDYTLTVDPSSDTTGAYSFRLLNYATAASFTPGTPVSDALNPATETDLYKFNVASPNSKFYFDAVSGIGNATWRLVDPFDNIFFDNGFTTDRDTLTLAQPGTYFLVIEGRRNAGAGSVAYTFNVVPVTTTTTPLTIGSTVNATIGVPGESDDYTFTLPSPAKLAFDTFVDNGNFTWTLTGPAGAVFVSSRSFQSSDSFDFSPPFMNLPAGNYTLTVDANNDATGAYSFRLLNYNTAVTVTPGTPVSDTLNPATETDIFKFNVATPNSKFYFDATSNVSNASWRLIDPFDNILFDNNLNTDRETMTLTQPGNYFLVVEGRRNAGAAPVSYSFNVVPVTFSSTALTIGSTVNSNISVPGERDDYTFTLPAAAKLAFDALGDLPNFTWTLTGAGGAAFVSGRSFQSSDSFDFIPPFMNLPAGSYTLTVDGSGDTTGAYAFRLLDYSTAVAITPGTPKSDTLNPATETDIYKFTVASPNSQFYFDAVSGISNASWRLVDPFDNVLFDNGFTTDRDTLSLGQPGTYFLVIEGRRNAGAASVPYTFNVVPVTPSTTPLTLGTTVNSNISVPGERDQYTFTLAAASRLAFDVLVDNGNFHWTLTGPGGAVLVNDRSFQNSDSFDGNPLLILPAASYTLAVDGTSDSTGAYSFRVLDLASATSLTPGTPVSSTLNPGNETDLFKFTVVTAGDTFLFDSTTPSINASWRLIDPFGNSLFTNDVPGLTSDQSPGPLNAAGVYTLLIEGRRNTSASQSYSFNVVAQGNTPPPAITGTALTFGTTINDTISAAGEQDNYQFTLASDANLYFDSFTDNGNVRWSLRGPAGTIISNRSFQSSDSIDIGDPQLRLPAGAYQLTVFMSGTATGPYSFRVLDLAAATPITPGTPFSGTLNPANETDAFKFNATAGDKLFFDVRERTGGTSARWRLIDPAGNFVFNNADFGNLNTDIDVQVMALTGSYTLLLEGRRFDTGTATYTVNVQPVTDSTTALNLGNVVNGNISPTGEQDNYTFTLASPATLYFDSFTDSGRFRWSLTGVGSTFVSNRSFQSSDSIDIGDPQLHLPAGSYTLTVDGVGDEASAYSFRLSDLANATPVTLNTPFSGTLNPANETDAFKFTANAGDHIYFDVQERTGATSARWRLIDPAGNFVFNSPDFGNINTDIDTLTMPLTGTYTLLIEGRRFDTGTGTYTINLQTSTDSTTPLTIGSIVNGNISVTGKQDNYTFTLVSPAVLYFDSFTDNGNLRWSLVGPAGTLISNRSFQSSDSIDIGDPQLRLPAGSYTLTVDATADNKPSYSFRLFDLGIVGTNVTPGSVVTGTLDPANETDVFKFTANAGDKFYFDVQERTGATSARWRLIDPAGSFVFNNADFGNINTDIDTLTVPLTGTYTLLIEGRRFDTGTGTYTFRIQPVTFTSTPLTLNTTTTGNISVTGEQDPFTFTLASPAVLYFDTLTSNNNLRWSLVGPGGVLVSNRGFQNSDSRDITDPQLRLPSGDYTLTVDGFTDFTGAYSFRLVDLATATPITKGAPFSGTLNPANETDFYKFTANAGDKIFFDVRARTGADQAHWRLIDPNGNFIFNLADFTNVNTDIDTQVMPLTGTYTLLLEGRHGDTVPGTYIVNVQPVIDGILPIVASGFFNFDLGPNHKIQFAFSQNVGASLGLNDFVLTNLQNNQTIPLQSVSYDNQNNIATVVVGSTLPEGNFRMTLVASGINDAFGHQLDGNADGVGGDDFLFNFFFLPGDANQDRSVNFNDLAALAQNYNGAAGKLFSQGDFNYDGKVDFNDLVILAQHYNFTLPPPPAAPLPAAELLAAIQPKATTAKLVVTTPPKKPFATQRITPQVLQSPAKPVAKPPPAKRPHR